MLWVLWVGTTEAGADGRGDLAGGEVGEGERGGARSVLPLWCQKGQSVLAAVSYTHLTLPTIRLV